MLFPVMVNTKLSRDRHKVKVLSASNQPELFALVTPIVIAQWIPDPIFHSIHTIQLYFTVKMICTIPPGSLVKNSSLLHH